jgi:hypothetical protein
VETVVIVALSRVVPEFNSDRGTKESVKHEQSTQHILSTRWRLPLQGPKSRRPQRVKLSRGILKQSAEPIRRPTRPTSTWSRHSTRLHSSSRCRAVSRICRLGAARPQREAMLGAQLSADWIECPRQHQARLPQLRRRELHMIHPHLHIRGGPGARRACRGAGAVERVAPHYGRLPLQVQFVPPVPVGRRSSSSSCEADSQSRARINLQLQDPAPSSCSCRFLLHPGRSASSTSTP